ncbi:metallophosphoesterase family protein [Paenibacillus segetis]|uniref:Serine/threonine protein phosphatase n=1 Tax=Paenibacillus segetis TaxID=1325360 RepID=A0ABQ1YG62_9BACL|nr:metallophosphoesterase family protein [Paenibacillus segetis]GGH23473.1 serine/threonine protein phosphatase [Paenibacillus segetis]
MISDIHGCYDEFNELLKKVEYKQGLDQLILVGDYVDRGLKSKEVVEQVKSLVEEWGVIALRGNHDQMMVDALEKENEEDDARWIRNGAFQTVESYSGLDLSDDGSERDLYIEGKEYIKNNYPNHLEFLKSLPLYYETDHHIFVHAGINPEHENWRESQPLRDYIWIRDAFFNHATNLQKKVVFGHTPVVNLHDCEDIWFSPMGDKIGIDGGCVFGFSLNCLEISEEGEYTTHFVKKGGL